MKQNKLLKSSIFFTITTVILSVMFSAIVTAANTGQSVNTIDAIPGEVITVPVSIEDSIKCISMSIEVNYNDSLFTLIDITDRGVIPGKMHTQRYSTPYTFTWENDKDKSDYTCSGVIAELKFRVSEDIKDGSYNINFSIPADGIITSDSSFISANFTGVKVVVKSHVHLYGDWKRSNGIRHYHVCECGEKQYENHDWTLTEIIQPTKYSNGEEFYECLECGSQKSEILTALGGDDYEITGTITSYGSATDSVTLRLLDVNGGVIDSTSTATETYSLSAPDGSYTLEVSKNNHVTRSYEVKVENLNVTQNIEIYLFGDVTGDGKINIADVGRLYSHVTGTNPLNNKYLFLVGDVTKDKKVNIADVGRLYSHVTGTNPLNN